MSASGDYLLHSQSNNLDAEACVSGNKNAEPVRRTDLLPSQNRLTTSFIVTPVPNGVTPIEIRGADGNVLWVGSNSSAKYYPTVQLGQIFYTEIADVSIDITPANIDFGQILFEEVKSIPVTFKIQSSAVNTKINLEYEFIDDVGMANLKIDAAGIGG